MSGSEILSEVFWTNVLSAIPPTLLALGALIASWRSGKASKRVEEKVNGSLDNMMRKLSENVKLVSDTKMALEDSIRTHEAQIALLNNQLDVANAHIRKLILTPDEFLGQVVHKEVVKEVVKALESQTEAKE